MVRQQSMLYMINVIVMCFLHPLDVNGRCYCQGCDGCNAIIMLFPIYDISPNLSTSQNMGLIY